MQVKDRYYSLTEGSRIMGRVLVSTGAFIYFVIVFSDRFFFMHCVFTSSVSSSLSGSCANLWEDIIKPHIKNVSERRAAAINKILGKETGKCKSVKFVISCCLSSSVWIGRYEFCIPVHSNARVIDPGMSSHRIRMLHECRWSRSLWSSSALVEVLCLGCSCLEEWREPTGW